MNTTPAQLAFRAVKRFILGSLFAIFGLCSFATAAPKIKIKFTRADAASSEIQEQVASRLNLTERYTVVTDKSADIVIDITCMNLGSSTTLFACAVNTYLWPAGNAYIATNASQLFTGEVDYIAKNAFTSIVNNTSDEKIKEMWNAFLSGVTEACKAGAAACNTLSVSQVH